MPDTFFIKCRVQSRGGVSPPASAECRMQSAELDKFVGADSISARFVGFLLIYGGVDLPNCRDRRSTAVLSLIRYYP